MSEPRVVLHIGLHKTATRFLQRAVFIQLDPEQFLVNPEPCSHHLRQAARHPGDTAWKEAAAAAAGEAKRLAGDRTLVLSDPSISGDMYSSHVDYAENLALVRELFPEATVIFFVRRQSDWLQSAYRQHLIMGRALPIEAFVNYYQGTFRPRIARVVNGARNVEAKTLRFLDIYAAYARAFGSDRVYLLRQEDLRGRPQQVYDRLAEALGMNELPELPSRISANRAFSALAIDLFFPTVHRPWKPPRQQDAERRPPRVLRRLNKPLRKLRVVLIRHAFDRIIYRDRDLLARNDMRAQLDRHYEQEYQVLAAVADEILANGPSPRALALAQSMEGAGNVPSN